jgi:hypothetical protein
MKQLTVFVFFVFSAMYAFGQDDGTDILFVKTKELDKLYIGKFAHLDYNKTSTGQNDTVMLMVNNTLVPFVSHKAANGREGLFYGQYSESAGYVDGYRVRLVKSRIDGVTGRHIMLTNYFDFYSKNNALMAGKSVTKQYQVSKKDVSQLLVKVDKTGT